MSNREQRPRRHFNYSNVMSTLAVFLVIAGGTALAAALPENSVRSKTVRDNALKSKDLKDGKAVKGIDVADGSLDGADIAAESLTNNDLANDSVDGSEIVNGGVDTAEVEDGGLLGVDITDNALTGADINESTLGQVPSALLGGFGRTGAEATCDPESETFITCAATPVLDVPPGARALILARVEANIESGAGQGFGECRLGTSSIGVAPNTTQGFVLFEDEHLLEAATLIGITPPLPAGATSFGIDCNQGLPDGAISYREASASVVLISAS